MKKFSLVALVLSIIVMAAITTTRSSTLDSGKKTSGIQVEILSVQFLNGPGYTRDPSEKRRKIIADLQTRVNNVLSEHESATVQWLQQSTASVNGSFTQLTAIVSY